MYLFLVIAFLQFLTILPATERLEMNKQSPKIDSAQTLIDKLQDLQDELGKGGRRLARFIIEQPNAAAVLSASDVAERCDVHASSVVRLAQSLGLSGYKEFQATLQQGLPELINAKDVAKLSNDDEFGNDFMLNLAVLVESGNAFNDNLQRTVEKFESKNNVQCTIQAFLPHEISPAELSNHIVDAARNVDGLILVAREHPAVNNAVRTVVDSGVPVVCFTSDLPSSPRTNYVGSDQFASGSTAGWLCGKFLPSNVEQDVLLVSSVPFRCQLDREQGFRQVLRSEFPHLSIVEKVSSEESPDIAFKAVRKYVEKSGAPAAIYNVSGANLGIARALEADNLVGKTVFIGHELTVNTRKLLETGVMDLTIGHDFYTEFDVAVKSIRLAKNGEQPVKHLTPSQIYTRHNCSST